MPEISRPDHGAKRRKMGSGKGAMQSRASKHSIRKSRVSKKPTRASRKIVLPKTAKVLSKRSESGERKKFSRANSSMNMTELQFLAKSRGIPFGGLSKTKLIRKINNYY